MQHPPPVNGRSPEAAPRTNGSSRSFATEDGSDVGSRTSGNNVPPPRPSQPQMPAVSAPPSQHRLTIDSAMLERVNRALDEIRAGKMVILVDDEDRENEGDLCLA